MYRTYLNRSTKENWTTDNISPNIRAIMKMDSGLSSKEILHKYLAFFKSRGHVEIPNVSLVPENDPTLLFVNAGMFPLVPYLMGQVHPMGTRLVNVQRCLRFEDLCEVGDNRHTTAFHMLGNWSLNDYFKKEQLSWIYKFLFEELGLDPQRIYATVFAGANGVTKDNTSLEILQEIFSQKGVEPKIGERIFLLPNNWWQRGDAIGELGGPDSEIFYYVPNDASKGKGLDLTKNEEKFLEIGNSVFLQYVKKESGWEQMPRQNVDFGGGLERLALVSQGKRDIFETDSFWALIEVLQQITQKNYLESPEITSSMRILADHVRSSVFLVMDGVYPSNKDQGYVLRRLLRKISRVGKKLGCKKNVASELADTTVNELSWLYPNLPKLSSRIKEIFDQEEEKFSQTLERASKEVERFVEKVGSDHKFSALELAQQSEKFYQSWGYPPEDFLADIQSKGIKIAEEDFLAECSKISEAHKELSRAGANRKFKGGLADSEEITIKYHTVAHLLHASLAQITKSPVPQEGSNIDHERVRFDFGFDRLLSPDELKRAEELINQKISEKLPVKFEILSKEDALKTGAMHLDLDKYGEKVKVYYVGENMEEAFSKEFCGGNHVENTSELQPVVLYKQEKMGHGVVRVYVKFRNSVVEEVK